MIFESRFEWREGEMHKYLKERKKGRVHSRKVQAETSSSCRENESQLLQREKGKSGMEWGCKGWWNQIRWWGRVMDWHEEMEFHTSETHTLGVWVELQPDCGLALLSLLWKFFTPLFLLLTAVPSNFLHIYLSSGESSSCTTQNYSILPFTILASSYNF